MKILRIIAILVCVSLVLTMSACGSKRELKREEKKLKEYLKAKYNDEFVINKLDYYIPQIGNLMIKGTASPEKDKDIVFEIISSSLDTKSSDKFGDDYRNNGHVDHYLSSIYWEEGEIDYKPFFDKILGDNSSLFETKIYLSEYFSGNNYLGYVPKYQEIKENYTNEMSLIVTAKYYEKEFILKNSVNDIVKLVNELKTPLLDYYRITIHFQTEEKEYIFRVWGEEIDKYLDKDYLIDNVLIIETEE